MATPMYPVNSSQLSYVGYDEETQELFITFKNGSTYKYTDVPKYIFTNLRSTTSVGTYFSDFVKNSYEYTKIK